MEQHGPVSNIPCHCSKTVCMILIFLQAAQQAPELLPSPAAAESAGAAPGRAPKLSFNPLEKVAAADERPKASLPAEPTEGLGTFNSPDAPGSGPFNSTVSSGKTMLHHEAPAKFVFKAVSKHPAAQAAARSTVRMDDIDTSEHEAESAHLANGHSDLDDARQQEPSSLSISSQLHGSTEASGQSSSLSSLSQPTMDAPSAREADQERPCRAGDGQSEAGQPPVDNGSGRIGPAATSEPQAAGNAKDLPGARPISNATALESRRSELMSFKQRAMPDLATARQVCDELRRKQAAFLKLTMDTLPWNAMSSEIVDITGYFMGIQPAKVCPSDTPVYELISCPAMPANLAMLDHIMHVHWTHGKQGPCCTSPERPSVLMHKLL